MALPSSGAISLSQIRDEYNNGSTDPIVFNDYYRGGSFVRANAENNTSTNLSASVPTSANNSPISIEDFLGAERGFKKTYSSNASNQTGAEIFGDDYSVDYPKFIDIDADTTVFSTSSSTPALDLATGAAGSITVTNSGNIYGQGGAASSDGGTALKVDVTTTVINNSGANIKGGGGGGGTGGTGGKGVASVNATLSELVDEAGSPYGGNNLPANDKPPFVTYSPSGGYPNSLNWGDRMWGGINGSNPQPGAVNTTWGLFTSSTQLRGVCANKGPMWCSFKLDKAATYSLSGSISIPFGGTFGNPTVDISTSATTASQGQGGALYGSGSNNWNATAELAADTKYYLTQYMTGSGAGNDFYYNNASFALSLTVDEATTGGTGGSGGVGAGFEQAAAGGSSGAGGGSNAGTGGTGGTGGGLGEAGATGGTGATGTGTSITYPASAPTSGATGSAGGLAGYYILGQSNVTLTNNGTVAGRIA